MARECGNHGCRLSSAHKGNCAPQRGCLAVRYVHRPLPSVKAPDNAWDPVVLDTLAEIDRWTNPAELALRSGCDVKALRNHVLPRLASKGLAMQDRRFWRAV